MAVGRCGGHVCGAPRDRGVGGCGRARCGPARQEFAAAGLGHGGNSDGIASTTNRCAIGSPGLNAKAAALSPRCMTALPRTDQEAAAELAALAEEIARHNRLYHTEDAPEISDADYDALRRRNSAIEAAFPQLVRGDSPSLQVGAAPAAHLAKVRHARAMTSLDNAVSDEEVAGFVARVRRFLRLAEGGVVALTPVPKIVGVALPLIHNLRPQPMFQSGRRRVE